MRGIDQYEEYLEAKEKFKESFSDNKECHEVDECQWTIFKSAFMEFTSYNCPMCEKDIDQYDDIDHFRPKSEYKFLQCCCDNYIMLCASCNRSYKRSSFPLEDAELKAEGMISLDNENPLLINPRKDDIFEYYELLFVERSQGIYLLELQPKENLDEVKSKKAKTTIEIYGIGDCTKVQSDKCRINILTDHYHDFIDLAEAMQNGQEDFDKELNSRRMEKKRKNGFVEFIKKGQFKIAT